MLTHESMENTEKLKMGPTSAEKLALQVNFTWLAWDYECTAYSAERLKRSCRNQITAFGQ